MVSGYSLLMAGLPAFITRTLMEFHMGGSRKKSSGTSKKEVITKSTIVVVSHPRLFLENEDL